MQARVRIILLRHKRMLSGGLSSSQILGGAQSPKRLCDVCGAPVLQHKSCNRRRRLFVSEQVNANARANFWTRDNLSPCWPHGTVAPLH